VIYEESKGNRNLEIHFDRRMHEKAIFPGINVTAPARRRETADPERALQTIWVLRKLSTRWTNSRPPNSDRQGEGTKRTAEFVESMRRG